VIARVRRRWVAPHDSTPPAVLRHHGRHRLPANLLAVALQLRGDLGAALPAPRRLEQGLKPGDPLLPPARRWRGRSRQAETPLRETCRTSPLFGTEKGQRCS
jgi:hypothetical protein